MERTLSKIYGKEYLIWRVGYHKKCEGFAIISREDSNRPLGIASSSTLFKEKIGKNLALGIEEEFKDEMTNVV